MGVYVRGVYRAQCGGGKGKLAGVSSSYHVGPADWIQVIRLGSWSLCLRGHLASPLSILTKINFL